MEILRNTLNSQHKILEEFTNTLDFIRDDISELDTKINDIESKLNTVKERIDDMGR